MVKESFYLLLQMVKENPGAYLDKLSLTLLGYFIAGYGLRVSETYQGIQRIFVPGYHNYCMPYFQEFVFGRFNSGATTKNYIGVILEHTNSEEDAFYTFFELLDEFWRSEHNNGAQSFSVQLDKSMVHGVYHFLYSVRGNPKPYLGENRSLLSLRMLLDGYIMGHQEVDSGFHITSALDGFQDFVQNKFGTASGLSWDQIIVSRSSSDSEAFDKFYALLYEFRGIKMAFCNGEPIYLDRSEDLAQLKSILPPSVLIDGVDQV